MKRTQKLLSMILLLAMLLSLAPAAALAEEPEGQIAPAGELVPQVPQDGDEPSKAPVPEEEEEDPCEDREPEAAPDAVEDGAEEPVRESEMTWSDLQAALDEGGEIVLPNDVTAEAEDSALVVPPGVTVSLELDGHSLDRGLSADTMEEDGCVIFVSGGATLRIAGGTVTGGGNNGNAGGIYADAGAVLELTNVAVEGNYCTDHGGGLYLEADSQCSAANSSFDVNHTTVNENGAGGGIYFKGGTLELTDCSISDNNSKNLGGGLYVGAGSAVLTGCEIDRNVAYANACGGGVFLSGGSLTLDSCEVCGNSSSKNDPHALGVFVNVGTMFIVSGDTKIMDNKRGSSQMNVFLHNGALIHPQGLSEDALIGVAVGRTNSNYVAEYRAGVVTGGLTGNGTAANFRSDHASYLVALNAGGEAILEFAVTVSFNSGDSNATGSMSSVKLLRNSEYTLPECGYSVRGKAFTGWRVSGQLLQPGDTIIVRSNITVTARWRLLGDVNGDGSVNTADVALLAKYVKARGQEVDIVLESANVDGSADGKITTADVALLAKYIKARGQGVVIH